MIDVYTKPNGKIQALSGSFLSHNLQNLYCVTTCAAVFIFIFIYRPSIIVREMIYVNKVVHQTVNCTQSGGVFCSINDLIESESAITIPLSILFSK